MEAAATTSSPSSAVVVPKPANRRTIPWPDAPAAYQNFSLPSSIVYYMAKNPSSPTVYNKLIQSGKYFFEENPILVVADMCAPGFNICSNEHCNDYRRDPCCVTVDINKISSKFWFTQRLRLFCWINEPTHFTALLRPKTYRCDVKKIHMICKDVIYDDFKFFASSVVDADIDRVKMLDNDGKMVPLEDIIKAMPKIKKFEHRYSQNFRDKPFYPLVTTPTTMKTIAKLMDPGQLELFTLDCIPADALDVDDLSTFITTFKDTKIQLMFDDDNSDGYKQKLDVLGDAVFASEIPNHLICYKGQDREKRKILCARYDGSFYVPHYI